MNNIAINNIGGSTLGHITEDFFEHPEDYLHERNITPELLSENGWERRYGNLGDNYFGKFICNNKYHLEFSPHSNMVGRYWSIHVDNCDFQTIGSCAIMTTKHFNDFMKLLNIDYRLV